MSCSMASALRSSGRPPASATARVQLEARARRHNHSFDLARQVDRFAVRFVHDVVVGFAVLAAEHATRAMDKTVAGNIGKRRLFRFDAQVKVAAGATIELTGAAGIRAELVMREEQRKPGFSHFDRAELQAAGRMPFAGVVPAVPCR